MTPTRRFPVLAYIYYYTKIHGRPPAESDLQRFFRVTPPVVHQMIITLPDNIRIYLLAGTQHIVAAFPPQLLGSYIPFATTKAARISVKDPRLSIEERYRGVADYLKRVRSAATDLIRGRFLLQEDLDNVLDRAKSHWDFATRGRPASEPLRE